MNFSQRITQAIQQVRDEQEQARLAREAKEKTDKAAAVDKVKEELAHILDDEWNVVCHNPDNPMAFCIFDIPRGNGILLALPFKIELTRAPGNFASYLPELYLIDHDSPSKLGEMAWTAANELTNESLQQFVVREILLFM